MALSSSSAEARLIELDISLPQPVSALAAYIPVRRVGSQLWISGQLPFDAKGDLLCGHLGDTVDIHTGQAAAKLCGLNILAHVRAYCGSLDAVRGVLRLGGFVACRPDFTDHPTVINGTSELMLAVFGEAGRHCRVAIGVASLPRGACVEVEAVFEIDDAVVGRGA